MLFLVWGPAPVPLLPATPPTVRTYATFLLSPLWGRLPVFSQPCPLCQLFPVCWLLGCCPLTLVCQSSPTCRLSCWSSLMCMLSCQCQSSPACPLPAGCQLYFEAGIVVPAKQKAAGCRPLLPNPCTQHTLLKRVWGYVGSVQQSPDAGGTLAFR